MDSVTTGTSDPNAGQSSAYILDQSNTTAQDIVDFIAKQPNAFFKCQQIDDEDLSLEEKCTIVDNIYKSNKILFLQRYGNFLDNIHLNHLRETSADNNEINSLIENLERKIKLKGRYARNRRFRAMQKLVEDGDYFSDGEMQTRNPYLFEQMIGQYMNEDERKLLQQSNYQSNYNSVNFSSFLMEQMRNIHLQCKYMVQEQENENDTESDDYGDSEENSNENDINNVDEVTKTNLKEEFKNQMIQSFLDGNDKDYFDYDTVDGDEELDLNKEYERDQEDKYFDNDD